MVIKGQDIVVALKLLSNEKARYQEIGKALALSPSQVLAAVRRLEKVELVEQVNRRTRRVNRSKLRSFVEKVVPDSFPADLGPITFGMPTAHAAQPLSSRIAIQPDALPPVWPDADGPVRGCELKPIHKCAVYAAKHDAKLYELLTLVDAIRSGRARERNIAMEELGARIVEPPNQAAAYPRVMRRGITEEAINQWAQTVSAQSVLPDLIRRLILFFVPLENIQALHFPAYSAANQSGLDGEVKTTVPVSLLADTRVSAWEISVEKDIKRNAGADFKKYENGSPLGHTPSDETYIALTGRIWRDKQAWVEAARKEKRWASVRAYDATDIAQWLALAPGVRAWFSEAIGQNEEGVETVETFFAKWASRTHPPLSEKVVVAGRDSERQQLVRWLRSPASPLTLQADTAEECVVFLCAVLLTGDAPARDVGLARTLILRSPEAWNRVLHELNKPDPPSMILVPAFDSFDRSRFGTGGHHLLIPRDRSVALRSQEKGIDLRAINREKLADALDESVIHDSASARKQAYECGGSLTKLQRLLGYAPKPPSWANESPDLLCAMLLAGAWDPRNKADLDVLCRLAGTDNFSPIEDLAEKLLHVSDPPLRMRGDFVKWRSVRDAWEELSHLINPRRLERFVKVATDVLSKRSPRFDIPPTNRFYASNEQTELPESKQIRVGLADSVAWLSTVASHRNQQSQYHSSDFTSAAEHIVSEILKDSDWRLWASLNENLQALAEGAPKAFLDALKNAAGNKASFAPLFAQDARGNGLFGECAHAGLLWALEILVWEPKWFTEVVRILVSLTQFDSGGQYVNRPLKALIELLHPFARRSWASNDQRIRELERLAKGSDSEPFAWKILLENLNSAYRGCSIDSNLQPRFLNIANAQGQGIPDFVYYTPAETKQMIDITRQLSVDALDRDPARLTELFSQGLITVMPDKVLDWMEDHLPTFKQWPTKEKNGLIRQIRVWMSESRKWRPGDVPETTMKHAESLAEQLEKSDPLGPAAGLFCDSAQHALFPGMASEDCDAELERLRSSALADAFQAEPGVDTLIRLIQAVPDTRLLGSTLANIPDAQEWEQPILERIPTTDAAFEQCACAFFANRKRSQGEAWFLERAQHLVEADRLDATIWLLLAVPSSPSIREWVQRQTKTVATEYWMRVNMAGCSFRDADDFHSAITALVSHARLSQAFTTTCKTLYRHATLCPTGDLLAILRAPFTVKNETSEPELAQTIRYCVPEILMALDTRPDVTPEDIAALEIGYIGLLEYSTRRPPIHIHTVLSKQPDLFVSLVTALFRPETKDMEPSDIEATTEQQHRPHHAFQILHSWSGYPGQELPPSERDVALRNWCNRVLELTAQEDRRIMGEQKVGEVLVRVPPPETDGIWPCLVAREYLRDGRSEIGEGLHVGQFNSRGSRCGLQGDHGEERDQAKKFENDADRIRAEWPETASLLDSMARDYRQWANQLDRHDARYTDP